MERGFETMDGAELTRAPEEPVTERLSRTSRGHIVELDSLRGLAAVTVVFDHYTRLWREDSPPHFLSFFLNSPLFCLVNGHAAVMLFFVLSGFVLTLPPLAGRQQPYPLYVARRVCRIYLPYVAALGVALLGCWLFPGRMIYGHEFQLSWRSAPQLKLVLQHLLLIGRFDVFAYDPPAWSLVHEMRISLVFPLLSLVAIRCRAWLAGVAVLLFPLLAIPLSLVGGSLFPVEGPGEAIITWSMSLGYCGIFLLGSMLARHQETIRSRFALMPRALKIAGFLVALVLFESPAKLHLPAVFEDVIIGLGAAYLVMTALLEGGWISRLLRLKPLRFLGKVSYSLYLIHMPILLVLSIAVYHRLPYGFLLLPYLVVTVCAAVVFYRVVEVSSIRLGRSLGS